jgi:hypothetical protein
VFNVINNRKTTALGSYYNAEIKQRFIVFCEEQLKMADSTVSNFRSMFNNTAMIEDYYDKDLCRFTSNQFVYLFEMLHWTQIGTKYKELSLLNHYLSWCSANGYCTGQALVEIDMFKKTPIFSHAKAQRYYFSFDDVMDKALKLFSEYDEHWWCRYIAIWYLGFNQCSFETIADLKQTDMASDFSKVTVRHLNACAERFKEVVIAIPENLRQYFRDLYADSYKDSYDHVIPIKHNGQLIPPLKQRQTGDGKIKRDILYNMTRSLRDKGFIESELIAFKDVVMCGEMYALYQHTQSDDDKLILADDVQNIIVRKVQNVYQLRSEYSDWIEGMKKRIENEV